MVSSIEYTEAYFLQQYTGAVIFQWQDLRHVYIMVQI